MSIVYSAVVQQKNVIASYAPAVVDFERDIVRLLPPQTSRIEQIISSNNVFSFLTTPLLTFACVSKLSTDRRLPLNYLDAISKKWAAAIEPIDQNPELHQYSPLFISKFGEFTKEYGADKKETNEKKKKKHKKSKKKTRRISEDDMENYCNLQCEEDGEPYEDDQVYNKLCRESKEFHIQVNETKVRIKQQSYKYTSFIIFAILIGIYCALCFLCGGYKFQSKCM